MAGRGTVRQIQEEPKEQQVIKLDTLATVALKTIRAELLDNYVWSLIMDVLSNPQDYIEHLKEASNSIVEEIAGAAALLEKELINKDKEVEKIKTLFRHGVIDEDEMLTSFKNVSNEKEAIEASLSKYKEQIFNYNEQQISVQKMKEAMAHVRDFIENGGKQLAIDEKRYVLDLLVDEVIVKYHEQDVILTIYGHLEELSNKPGVILQKKFKLIQSKPRNEKIIVELTNE